MKCCLHALLFFFIGHNGYLQAQAILEKGTVSYVSSQNVYVKFASTKGINIGDTLFVRNGETLVPALRVTNKSSVSCVCSRLGGSNLAVSNEIVAKKVPEMPKADESKAQEKPPGKEKQAQGRNKKPGKTTPASPLIKKQSRQNIRARLSAASYSSFSDRVERARMRYAFSMQGNNFGDSGFSTEVNVVFRHTLKEWQAVKNNLNDALKIYGLSVKYDFNPTTHIALGRRINPRISNLGAVDGIQFEKGLGHFVFGATAGARPDMRDYSINFDLMQAGAYVGLVSRENERNQQSTLGIIEQHNRSAVDRRFVYFQHSDDLLTNLNIFSSMEMDLYENISGESKSKLSLTNLFVSLRYKFSRKFSANLSYDNRRNIIYYESYKTYIDQVIDNETRQGMRFGFNYRPVKMLSWGGNASWRFQKSSANESKNLNTYLNINQIPGLKTSASITANFLQTSYINSRIFGLRLMKDVFKGKVNTEVYYRRVDYDFPLYGYATNQNVVGGSLSWQILKKLSMSAFVEKTFDSPKNDFMLINTRLMQRF
ncbi:MAG: hypothetical protein IPK76_04960 [Lewinellaceae bacterium]|nr:hypothetical protein [Lewinellaceae bacterium]